MLKSYFLTALRTIRRNMVFSVINVLGLSIGISAALVIYLIVHYDLSFDKFHKDGDRIYRVVSEMRLAGEPFPNAGVPYPLPEAARKELTGIDEAAALYIYIPKVKVPSDNHTNPRIFKNQREIVFTDTHYFELFSFYTWMVGSPVTSLQAPFQVVLTESRARTYFPGSDPSRVIGRQIVYDDSIPATVTGILRDPSEITDLNFKEFISLSTITSSGLKNDITVSEWRSLTTASQFFIKLSPATRPGQIESQLAQLRKKYTKDADENGLHTVHHLQPLSDIHFNGTYASYGRTAHMPTLYGLMLVAVFLLTLGCINFINLTTAQASQRAKEIGIRKTLGSSARQLVFQFLGETFLLTLLSLIISLALTPWLLHIFSDFIPAGLHTDLLRQPGIFLFLFVLLIIVTILSGFYPAMVLSRFRPVLVLKNQAYAGTATTRSAWLRRTLTISQFVIAQVFIMATLIVGRQIHYSLNTDLGFKKEAIVYFDVPFNWQNPDNKQLVLLNRIRSIPGIEIASIGAEPPSSPGFATTTMKYKDGKKEIETDVQTKRGDTNYIKIYHLRLLAGRNVQSTDTSGNMIINQTFARLLGFTNPQEAIGKSTEYSTIIGVISDFHQASLHTPIKPLALTYSSFQHTIHIALLPQNTAGTGWQTTLAQVEKVYKQIYPEGDFHYEFFDESIARLYTREWQIVSLLKWATGLTIFISCLGLAGLVIYTTNLRTKEIGVRKVLGASVAGIVSLLSKDFIKLMGIAFVVATPIAWWALNKWLENFAYRISISWWIFPLSGALMLGIALVTMSIRTIRAAIANPVKSLRTE